MRNSNKKGLVFGKISIVDIAVIIIVILLAAGTFYKFKGLSKTSTNTPMTPVTYTVEVKKVRAFVFDNVKEGDILYDKTSGNSIGTIVNIEGTPAKEATATTNGDVALMEVKNRVDVKFTVEAEAVVSNDGTYSINRTYDVIKNSAKTFMTKYFQCSGTITEISEK